MWMFSTLTRTNAPNGDSRRPLQSCQHLRANRSYDAVARQWQHRAILSPGRSQPGGVLPALAASGAGRRGNGVAAPDSTPVRCTSGHYGIRRITRALRAKGLLVNHKRVERLMQLDNLLAVRKRKF